MLAGDSSGCYYSVMQRTFGELRGAAIGAVIGVLLAGTIGHLPYGVLSYVGMGLLGAFIGAGTLGSMRV